MLPFLSVCLSVPLLFCGAVIPCHYSVSHKQVSIVASVFVCLFVHKNLGLGTGEA